MRIVSEIVLVKDQGQVEDSRFASNRANTAMIYVQFDFSIQSCQRRRLSCRTNRFHVGPDLDSRRCVTALLMTENRWLSVIEDLRKSDA